MDESDNRGRWIMGLCLLCAALSLTGLLYVAPQLKGFATAQAEQTDLLNKVLKRIPGMTTYSQDVTNQANHVIHVSVTCRENERPEDCFARFVAAVAIAAASTT